MYGSSWKTEVRKAVSFLVAIFSVPGLAATMRGSTQSFCVKVVKSKKQDTILQIKGHKFVDHSLTGNGIGIGNYPVSFIRNSLEITDQDLAVWKTNRAVVLSVAEGYGHFLPFLLRKRIQAIALDLFYGSTQRLPRGPDSEDLRQFVRKYKNHLIAGSAFHMPIESESVNVLLSHRFVNNLDEVGALIFTSEAIRVLKVKGEARINGFSSFHMKELLPLQERLKGYVRFHFKGGVLFLKKLRRTPK